jgi:hypothetical protein
MIGQWFSTCTLVSSNKTDSHNITEILLKAALNTIALTLYFNSTDFRVQKECYTNGEW